jgi:hypothetical protein
MTLRPWLVAAVCAAVLVGASPPAVGSAAAEQATGFETSTYAEHAGDVARIGASVPPGSTTTLAVGGPGYHTRVDVVDADRDGRVVVRLNTFLAGWRTTERAAYGAAGGDRLARVVRESPRRSTPLASGPYALRLTGPVDDRARLDLAAAAFDAAVPYPVPRDARPDGPDDLRALAVPSETVATGDWAVVTFRASGLGGVARVDDAPATNLVYAAESAPGAASTHVVRRTITANGSPATLTLDYDAGDGASPGGLARLSAATIDVGYDRTDDGVVDVDLASAVERVTVPERGTVSISFADAPAAVAGDRLVLELPVTNPDERGTDRVAVSVDGSRTVGTVEYGLAGSGALGNGLDLRLTPVGGDGSPAEARTVSPAVHDVVLDEERDALSVVFDTRRLDRDTYAATLSLTPANPTVNTPRALTASFSVVDRRVTFVRPAPSFVAEDTTPVSVDTTLAPGSELTLHVTSPSDPGVLQVYLLTVDADRTASVDAALSDRFAGDRIRLVVRDDGRVVAGPRAGRRVSTVDPSD